jgi:hypothetical protein
LKEYKSKALKLRGQNYKCNFGKLIHCWQIYY